MYTLAFVMAGGVGSRLEVLTRSRSKPAVGFLNYRIADFVLTNLSRSGIQHVLIAAQYEPRSLERHIGSGGIWGFGTIDRRLELVQPYRTIDEIVAFDGTADSVRKTLPRINDISPDTVMVLGGDHIYSTGYDETITYHLEKNAEMTLMVTAVPKAKVGDFGLVRVNENMRIIEFIEKPTDEKAIERFKLSPEMMEKLGIAQPYLASMGNYIFSLATLNRYLEQPGIDFGRDILPGKVGSDIFAYVFAGYWRDVGKIEDFYQAHMDFLYDPPIDLEQEVIYTRKRQLPPARIGAFASVSNSLLSDGNQIFGERKRRTRVDQSIFGYQVRVLAGSKITKSLFLGADRDDVYGARVRGSRDYTIVGESSVLNSVILDKNVRIGQNTALCPEDGTPQQRRKALEKAGLEYYDRQTGKGDFYITDSGILVLGKNTRVPEGLVA
jgi:glucose-1-phosphate adenylyltransferase